MMQKWLMSLHGSELCLDYKALVFSRTGKVLDRNSTIRKAFKSSNLTVSNYVFTCSANVCS